MFGLNREKNMLKYSAGTRINKASLKTFRDDTVSIRGIGVSRR